MTPLRIWILVSLALWAVSPATAQEPGGVEQFTVQFSPRSERADNGSIQPISLSIAIDRALAENIDLALARAEEQLAQGTHFTSQARLYPSLEVDLGGQRLDGRVQGSFGELRNVAYSTYLGGVSLIYGANVAARLKQALAERRSLEIASLNSLNSEQRLLLRVVELYQDLLLATVALQVSEEVVADSEQFLTLVKAQTAAGLGLGADVARAEAKLAANQQHEVQARTLLINISTRLAVVLRLDVDTLLKPVDEQLAPARYLEPSDPSVVEDGHSRPDVQAAEQQAIAAQQFSSAAKLDLYAPELRAEIEQLSLGDTTDDFDRRSERRLLLLWTFSPVALGELRQRRAEEILASLHLAQTEDRAAAEIRRAEEDLKAARERMPLAGNGLRAATDTLRLSEARFKAGSAIAIEVLDAQDSLAEARFNLARAIVEYNIAQARLLAATGNIERDSFQSLAP